MGVRDRHRNPIGETVPTTPILELPYPSPSDPSDIPSDLQALAEALEALANVPPMGNVYCPGHNPGPNVSNVIPMTGDRMPAQMQGGMVKASGGLQVPDDGVYLASANVTIDGGSPAGRYDFGINNLTRTPAPPGMSDTNAGLTYYHTGGAWDGTAFSAAIPCSAGDVIVAMMFAATAAVLYPGGFTWLSVTKV
jgi:hypothetical protein